MDIKQIEELAFNIMKDRKIPGREKGFIYYHGKRTANIALNIYNQLIEKGSKEEMDLLYCGCLFHDVGKGIEPHNETGKELVNYYLQDICNVEQREKISRIVYEHNLRGEKYGGNSFLGKIAQDADILDHMGTMDIWIAFQWHAAFDERVEDSLKFFLGGQWQEIIEKLRSLLNFSPSIDAFDRRKAFTEQFLRHFKRESEGKLY
jgi:uncharacterized protein